VGFYNTTFQGKDHELVTLEFRDKIQDIIAESDTLRAQIHKEKALHKKISALRQRIDENNGLLEQQKKLFEKYSGSPKEDIRKGLYERKSDYDRQLEKLSSIHGNSGEQHTNTSNSNILNISLSESFKDDSLISPHTESGTERERLELYTDLVTSQIDILNVSTQQIDDENSANELLLEKYSNDLSKVDLTEKLKELNRTYSMLVNVKLKTVYDLPEPFKDGNLISPYQVSEVLAQIGIEKSTLDKLNMAKFVRFCGRCLELPDPEIEGTSNLTAGYISHIDDLIRLYRFRLREDVFNFHYYTSIHDLIGEQSPYEETEKAITAKVMNAMEERDSSQGRDAFSTIFKDLGYHPDENHLMELIGKAIPGHSLGLFQVLSTGLNNYEGFSFKLDDDVPLPVKTAEKILKNEHNINEEFYGCRNRVVRDKFNLDVLQVIRDNFTKYAASTVSSKGYDSDDDTIF
jgi:hypothetical protein